MLLSQIFFVVFGIFLIHGNDKLTTYASLGKMKNVEKQPSGPNKNGKQAVVVPSSQDKWKRVDLSDPSTNGKWRDVSITPSRIENEKPSFRTSKARRINFNHYLYYPCPSAKKGVQVIGKNSSKLRKDSFKKCLIVAKLLQAFGFNYWKESRVCQIVKTKGKEIKNDTSVFIEVKKCNAQVLSRWTALYDNVVNII